MSLGAHAKVGIGWAIVTVTGIYSFYLAKTNIEKRRYDNMKIREHMRQANFGEYEASYRKFSTTSSSN